MATRKFAKSSGEVINSVRFCVIMSSMIFVMRGIRIVGSSSASVSYVVLVFVSFILVLCFSCSGFGFVRFGIGVAGDLLVFIVPNERFTI